MDERGTLTVALKELLEASDKHDTLYSKELAVILCKSHHTVRRQWEQILLIYQAHCRYEAREKWKASKREGAP